MILNRPQNHPVGYRFVPEDRCDICNRSECDMLAAFAGGVCGVLHERCRERYNVWYRDVLRFRSWQAGEEV